MPGHGPHIFEFVGEDPPIVRLLVGLGVANFFVYLALGFSSKYLFPIAAPNSLPTQVLTDGNIRYSAPRAICWYADHAIMFEAFLISALIISLIVYRKQIRYVYHGPKRRT